MTHWPALLRNAAALFGAALGVCAAGGSARAEAWNPTEDDQLLLELRSGAYKLGEPMRGYQTPTGVCLDFADLIQTLDLPVRLDKKSRRATGWLFAEDQRFVLDRDANTVQTMNGTRGIAAGAIVDTPEGWCMDLGALSGWMGVRFKPDLGNLTVVLESDRKLPFLEAIERKSRADSISSTSPRCRKRSCRTRPGARHRSMSSCRRSGPGPAARGCSTRRWRPANCWA